MEARARANNETLILAGSLVQKPPGLDITHAERVFDLKTMQREKE